MNPILYMLSGAAALAAAAGLYIGGKKAFETASELVKALAVVPALVKAMMENSEALKRFSGELEFLRTAVVGGTPKFGPEQQAEQRYVPRGTPMPVYPGAPPFMPAPDAEESDTVVVDTTDEEYAEQERLETVRGMGFEVEPLENPPGVERDV